MKTNEQIRVSVEDQENQFVETTLTLYNNPPVYEIIRAGTCALTPHEMLPK
jgi:hypothetical protein